ncbi:hypothetical protein PROFUN_11680 [Planoprotostelium fungivorum]|uniref:Uncharacterized protein n=1 Tax=Planoprotostelium fungivorum TaxID=1890364 RepID=A0A2P6N5A1_9EUKA|nr:hypothetical protein PROFUN_11680 [Planoprotostelium fungivorum]
MYKATLRSVVRRLRKKHAVTNKMQRNTMNEFQGVCTHLQSLTKTLDDISGGLHLIALNAGSYTVPPIKRARRLREDVRVQLRALMTSSKEEVRVFATCRTVSSRVCWTSTSSHADTCTPGQHPHHKEFLSSDE